MKISTRFIVAALVLVWHMAPVSAQTPSPTAPKSVIVERVLVRVNGEIFTQTQLTQRQIDEWRDRNKTAAALPDDATLRTMLTELTPDILVSTVDELLLVQRAKELGLKFTDEDFKRAIDAIKKQNKLDDTSLKAALTQEGLTLETLRQNFERTQLINQVQGQEFGRSISLTQEELHQYYDGHKNEFMSPATVTLRELLISAPAATPAGNSNLFGGGSASDAKAKADALRARAIAGEDFAALVREASQSATKTTDGLIGPIDVADLNPTLKDLTDKMQPGQVSEAVRAPGGYQLFKLEARAVPEIQPFEKVKTEIEQSIRQERIGVETEKLLTRLRAQAVLEWKDAAFRQMYEKRLTEKPDKP